jgi:hypothetical protein
MTKVQKVQKTSKKPKNKPSSMVHTPTWDDKQGFEQMICDGQPLNLSEI